MRRARKLLLGPGALCLIALGGVGLSSASFSAQRANPSNTFTAATSFCTSPGTESVTADRDTWIDESSPTAAPSPNGSTATSMNVTSRSSNRNARALVGFTLPTKPTGCSVTAATLKLFATASVSSRVVEALRIDPTDAGWNEATAKWNDDITAVGTAAESATGSNLRSWTVTDQVGAMYSSTSPNSGFLMKDKSESQQSAARTQTYSTSEASSNKPVLQITFG